MKKSASAISGPAMSAATLPRFETALISILDSIGNMSCLRVERPEAHPGGVTGLTARRNQPWRVAAHYTWKTPRRGIPSGIISAEQPSICTELPSFYRHSPGIHDVTGTHRVLNLRKGASASALATRKTRSSSPAGCGRRPEERRRALLTGPRGRAVFEVFDRLDETRAVTRPCGPKKAASSRCRTRRRGPRTSGGRPVPGTLPSPRAPSPGRSRMPRQRRALRPGAAPQTPPAAMTGSPVARATAGTSAESPIIVSSASSKDARGPAASAPGR